MTSPQIPSNPITSPYALVANAGNGATSGLGEFASWTQADWDDYVHGKWQPHFTGIGGPLAAAWEWINAITSAFQGDLGPLETLVGDAIDTFVVQPLSYLLAWILDDDPENWDTLAELEANLVPALMRLPIKIMAQLLGLIPVVGNTIEKTLTDYLAATANTASTAGSAASSAVTTAQAAQTAVVDLRQELRAVSVTQQWVSLSGSDIASFPRVLLGLGNSSTTGASAIPHTHGLGSTSANGSLKTASGDNPVNVVGLTGAVTSSPTHSHDVSPAMPTLAPDKGVAMFVPLTVDRYCRARYLKMITGDAGWSLFNIDYWYLGLYKYNPNDGKIYKIYDAGDQKANIATARKLHAFDMGTGLANLTPGEILFGAQLQNAGLLVSTRPIAALWQPDLIDTTAEVLTAPHYTMSGQTALATSYNLSDLTPINSSVPWMGVGTIAAA